MTYTDIPDLECPYCGIIAAGHWSSSATKPGAEVVSFILIPTWPLYVSHVAWSSYKEPASLPAY